MKFSEKGAGGGGKAVRKFSGNSLESGETGFPKLRGLGWVAWVMYEKLQNMYSQTFSKIFQDIEGNMRHPVLTTYHHLQHVSIHTSHWGQYIISISACAINKNELACKVHACQRERRRRLALQTETKTSDLVQTRLRWASSTPFCLSFYLLVQF